MYNVAETTNSAKEYYEMTMHLHENITKGTISFLIIYN